MLDILPPRFIVFGLLAGCAGRNARLVTQQGNELAAKNLIIQALERNLETCGSTDAPDGIYRDLSQVFSESDFQIEQRGSATIILTRASLIYSDIYALQFREEADNNIDLLGTALLLNPDHSVAIRGHTGDRPIPEGFLDRYPDHLSLSVALSKALADHLADHYDIAEERFSVAGRGAFSPVESNDLESGQDANTRLEVMLYPAGALPPAPP